MTATAATIVAAGIAAVALALRIGAHDEPPGLSPELLPPLFIAGSLCIAALLRRRLPAGAWLAAVVAGALSAIDVVGYVRFGSATDPGTGRWLIGIAELALTAAALLAATYAARANPHPRAPSRTSAGRVWELVIWSGFGLVLVLVAWALVELVTHDLPPAAAWLDGTGPAAIRTSSRVAVGFVAIALVVGIARDVWTPLRRAFADAHDIRDVPRALREELLPNASTFQRQGREEERMRLAADLHAIVLPDLRRAARIADAAGDAGESIAADIRQAVTGIERLMNERHPVVLESFGLVAALEWLAERTQAEGPRDVVVDLDGVVDDPAAIPRPVTRAAFRVAMLAVDNVIRHAGATALELRLEARDGGLALSIVDDGRAPAGQERPTVGRGVADMRAAAAEVGAALEIRPSQPGRAVEFRWSPAPAGHHAATSAVLADTRQASPP